MLGGAIDRRNRFVADDKGANVAFGFADVFLNVKDRMMIRAKYFLVLENGFGGVTVVDLGKQAPPRTNGGL